MIVTAVHLRNFRNYEQANAVLDKGLNLIMGDNAQGKTNLLESLVYLSVTRSHRISTDAQLIKDGCSFASCSCTIQEREGKKDLSAILYPGGKTLTVDHVAVSKSSEFIGALNTVLFAPDDLMIFHAAPRERRRLMDTEIGKIAPKYLTSLSRYKNLLKDRNTLLKRAKVDEKYLDVLDEQMIAEEVIIIEYRRAFFKLINEYLAMRYEQLSGEKDLLHLDYICCCSGENVKSALEEMMRNARSRDLENHVSTCGIHREDMAFLLGEKNVVMTASQGQKRMSMLAFRFSILDYIQESTGKSAVLLLDDVLSELDLAHQKRLMDLLHEGHQCVLTLTSVPSFMKEYRPAVFRVQNGTIVRIQGGCE